MVTTVTMSDSDVKNIESNGESAASTIANEYSLGIKGFSADYKKTKTNTRQKQQDALNALENAARETKTFVLGGDPPETSEKANNYGFGEWAATVQKKPMPVKITLEPLVKTRPFQCDLIDHKDLVRVDPKKEAFTPAQKTRCSRLRASISHSFIKYQDDALRSVKDATLGFGNKYTQHLLTGDFSNTLDSKTWGGWMCEEFDTTPLRSENGAYTLVLSCTGNLAVIDRNGEVVWETETKCDGQTVKMDFKEEKWLEILCGDDIMWSSFSQVVTTEKQISKDEFEETFWCNKKGHEPRSVFYEQTLTLENNGNLQLWVDAFKSVSERGFLVWQSGTGMFFKKPYPNHKKKYGYHTCSENQNGYVGWMKEYKIKAKYQS